jgi:hypothetical protein
VCNSDWQDGIVMIPMTGELFTRLYKENREMFIGKNLSGLFQLSTSAIWDDSIGEFTSINGEPYSPDREYHICFPSRLGKHNQILKDVIAGDEEKNGQWSLEALPAHSKIVLDKLLFGSWDKIVAKGFEDIDIDHDGELSQSDLAKTLGNPNLARVLVETLDENKVSTFNSRVPHQFPTISFVNAHNNQ